MSSTSSSSSFLGFSFFSFLGCSCFGFSSLADLAFLSFFSSFFGWSSANFFPVEVKKNKLTLMFNSPSVYFLPWLFVLHSYWPGCRFCYLTKICWIFSSKGNNKELMVYQVCNSYLTQTYFTKCYSGIMTTHFNVALKQQQLHPLGIEICKC